jgi:hypothetical protein
MAVRLLNQSLAISEEIGFREEIAWCLNELGLVALRRADLEAEETLRANLEIRRELGDQWRETSVLQGLAAAAALSGDLRRAAGLLGAAERPRPGSARRHPSAQYGRR